MKILKTITILVLLTLLSIQTSCSTLRNRSIPSDESELKGIMQKVADWQINNFTYKKTGSSGYLHDYGIDAWTNATLYIGMLEWAKMADNQTVYYDWLNKIGTENNWNIPANFKENQRLKLYHADELCIGQFYLGMYDLFKNATMIRSTQERVDWIMNNPPDSNMKNKQAWSWCDALFMAPAVYAHIAKMTNNDTYLKFMDVEFKKTYNYLYNKEYKLFFRDGSYFEKKEQNGEKIFWGRGNGWVAAGLVNILKLLPEKSAYRPFYESLFKEFVPVLAKLQDGSGFWHASLLDPESYPAPETSATALITYALAYGINNGLLSKDVYQSVTKKAWAALTSVVDKDGKLGWVQPIGADPKDVTADMTAVYGVGAFLLAGTEMYKLNN
ncbi:MAG: glycoside hydrolase family 105 protein [Dysgonomonas sp.]